MFDAGDWLVENDELLDAVGRLMGEVAPFIVVGAWEGELAGFAVDGRIDGTTEVTDGVGCSDDTATILGAVGSFAVYSLTLGTGVGDAGDLGAEDLGIAVVGVVGDTKVDGAGVVTVADAKV
jgi:hypothetical protein